MQTILFESTIRRLLQWPIELWAFSARHLPFLLLKPGSSYVAILVLSQKLLFTGLASSSIKDVLSLKGFSEGSQTLFLTIFFL